MEGDVHHATRRRGPGGLEVNKTVHASTEFLDLMIGGNQFVVCRLASLIPFFSTLRP